LTVDWLLTVVLLYVHGSPLVLCGRWRVLVLIAFLLSAPDRNGIKAAYCGLSYYLITGCHFKTILKSFATLCSAIVVPLAFPLSSPLVSPVAYNSSLLSRQRQLLITD